MKKGIFFSLPLGFQLLFEKSGIVHVKTQEKMKNTVEKIVQLLKNYFGKKLLS